MRSTLAAFFALPLFLQAHPITFNSTLSYSSTQPTGAPAASVANWTGAAFDAANLGGSGVNANGGANNGTANDGTTYVANNQPVQGQTFATGNNANGYDLSGITVRMAGYTNNIASGSNTSAWNLGPTNGPIILTVGRVLGTAHTTLLLQNFMAGDTGNPGASNSANGSGTYLTFNLSAPLHLESNTTYSFDFIIGNGGSNFFEWLGINSDYAPDPYAGGTAYTRSWGTITPLAGDRIFQANLTASGTPYAPFVHPGALHTQADFDRMAAKVTAGTQPWKADFDILANSPWAQAWWPAYNVDFIVRGASGNNYTRSQQDAQSIYELALRWKITGDVAYADKAVEIANVWSDLIGLQGDTNRSLAAGICGYLFAVGGEILSTYPGWPAAQKQAYKDMMMRVFYPENWDFLWRHHDTFWRKGGNTHYRLNWDTANMASMAAIGILCDNRGVYQQAVDYFKYGPGNGRVERAGWYMHPGGLGQGEEAGRDQGHNLGGWYAMSLLCQMAWNQGDDLFAYDNNRVLRVFEYNAKYNLWNDVPYARHQTCDLGYSEGSVSGATRGLGYPQYELVFNHYVNVKGIAAPWSQLAAEASRPEPRPNPSIHPSQVDWLGLGSLTFSRDPFATDQAPTGLRAHWSKNRVMLDWWGSARATSYLVKRGTASGGPYTQIGTVNGPDLNFTDANVSNGAAYFYVVTAVTPTGNRDSASLRVAQELVTRYTFESNANDLVGTRHGTLKGGTTAPGFAAGFGGGQAVSLSGANQYVQLPVGSGNYQDITISTWVYWAGGGNWQRVFDFGTEIEKTMYLTIKNGGGGVEFGTTTTKGGNFEGDASYYLRGPAIAVNQWVHLAVTINGDTGTLYVNGLPVATKVIDLVDPLFGQPFCYLGRSMYNADPYFQGRIDDFRIYNYALSGNEVYAAWGQSSNSPPTFTSDPILKSATEDNSISGQTLAGSATDANGGTLVYTKVTGPTWLTVATDGALSGTPANSDVGVNLFVVRVTDSAGATDDANLYITVTNTNDGPLWSANPIVGRDVTRDQPYLAATLVGMATDVDAGDSLTYSKASGPSWLSVAADGTLSGTPGAADVGLNSFVTRVTDSAGAFSNATLNINVLPYMLRSLFTFEGNANDGISGFHGTSAGSPTFENGRLGQGLVMDGIEDALTLPDGVAGYHDITIATFVWWNGGGNYQRIFDFGDNTSQFLFLTPNSGSGMRFEITNAGSTQQINTTALPTGRWIHVAVTLNGNTGTMYVNGSPVATNTGMTINPGDFRPSVNFLGDSQFPADPLFNGKLDDFRVYNYALPAAEVFDIANPVPEVPSGLVTTGLQAKVVVSWNVAQAAQTYTLRRSATSGGPYSTVASSLSSTSYTDAGLSNGVTYYYVVTASNAKGTSADSAEITGTPSDLLAHLRFDESSGSTAADSSGNGYHASFAGSPSFVAGQIGNAVQFASASNQSGTLPNGLLSTVDDFTISMWVKLTTISNWQRIFDFGTGTNNYMFLTPQNGSNGRVRFAIRTPSVNEQIINGTAALPIGVWTHVVVTLSGTTGSLYVNGTLVGTNTGMTLKPSSLGNTTLNFLADSQFSADPLLNGAIDDFRIYSRALSAVEIGAFQTPLTAPLGVTATTGPQLVTLNWSSVTAATSYRVKTSTVAGGSYTLVGTISGTTFTHTGLPMETRYYVVSAINITGEGPPSAEVNATPESAAISAAEQMGGTMTISAGSNECALKMKASVIGHTYQAQFTDDLANGHWENVGAAQTGTGNDLTFTLPYYPGAPQGFYRILIQR